MEVVNTVILIFINLLVIKFLLDRNSKLLKYFFGTAVLFIVLNLATAALSYKLILIVLCYSFGILILNFIARRMDVTKKNPSISESAKETFAEIKFYLLAVILPLMSAIFQIILVWSKGLQHQILRH